MIAFHVWQNLWLQELETDFRYPKQDNKIY